MDVLWIIKLIFMPAHPPTLLQQPSSKSYIFALQCHRDMGVGSFYSANQSDSHDVCEAFKPCPSNNYWRPYQPKSKELYLQI